MTVYTKALAASASLILLVTAHCRALSQNPAAPGTRKPAATLSQPVAKPAHPRVVVPRPSLPPQSGSGGNGYNDYREFNSEGMRLQSEGKLDEAAEQYRKALQLKPSSSAAHNNLALVLKDLGDFAAAEKEARFALRLKPDRGDYHFNLGMILEKQSKFSEARQEYSQAVKADAMDAES
ncbi:MAG TPA: tetratricopeptide repeat protein, partial [Chroococcales cyanobacterium]